MTTKNFKYDQNKPLFFLFTCVKNGRSFIQRLFNSLLNQSKINFVHYIYEDGSDEPLGELVSNYIEDAKEKGIKVYYEYNDRNIGLNLSTKHCIDKCNLPFFIWIDCDNWVDESFFEELEKLQKRNKKAVVLRSKRVLINYDTGSPSDNDDIWLYKNSISAKKSYDQYLIFGKYYFSFFAVSSTYYRCINVENLMIDNRSFFNDQQILFICSKNKQLFTFSERAIGYCLIRGDSESSTNYLQTETMLQLFDILNKKMNINQINYTDCLLCISLAREHRILLEKNKLIEAHHILLQKRAIFKRNKIKNKVFPFCSKSLFSLIYFLFPRFAELLLKMRK